VIGDLGEIWKKEATA